MNVTRATVDARKSMATSLVFATEHSIDARANAQIDACMGALHPHFPYKWRDAIIVHKLGAVLKVEK